MSEAEVRISEEAADSARTDADWPHVPPGDYEVSFVGEFKARLFGRDVWVVRMRVTAGEHAGVTLPWYLNAIPKGKRPTSGFNLCSAFLIATERRPPLDLWRRRPSSFLKDCAFIARVRTKTRDRHHVELPEAGHSSKIECLVKCTAGHPKYLGVRDS